MAEKEKTIPQILDEIASEICDKYCRFPYEISDEEELMKKCENCPIGRLI